MAKFRKRPIVIEADQFFFRYHHPEGVQILVGGPHHPEPGSFIRAWIHTLEGDMEVSEGDWIITGVKGEKYPCKPDIFAATYETAEEPYTYSEKGKL